MNESQKIVFQMALEKLRSGIERKDYVSSANFSHNRDESGKPIEKYQNWAKESDLMSKELSEALDLLLIIKRESEK